MDKTISETTALWDRVLKKINDKLQNKTTYDFFFSGTYISSIEQNQLIIVTTTKIASEILSTSYKALVDSAIQEVSETNYEAVFIDKDSLKKSQKKITNTTRKYFQNSCLNTKYNFENFVVGSSNREACQAALCVSQNPGKFYNPVLIYGNSGLGKTHLLHAIGNEINKCFPSYRVLYMHAQDFLDEYVKYVNGNKTGESLIDWFKSSVDVLLVDDVQFLVNKKKTEETFFSIYDSFYSMNKQVVLTSDQHPSKLNGLDERLKSRFVQGLPLSIDAPEKETCELILKLKIKSNGLDVNDFSPEVISFFAEKFRKNIRELEGAFDRLLFYVVNIKKTKKIDIETAMDSIRSLIDVKNSEEELSMDAIVKAVANFYNLAPYQLTGKIRTSQIALARHISMYLSRTLLNVPLIKIGEYFGGKDHTTVINGVKKVEKMLKTDTDMQDAINKIKASLNIS